MTKEALIGIHHVTAITSDAKKIYDFFTRVLGLRLVKKNVNQDDLQTYHLYFADDRGNPGTDMTFFDFSGISSHLRGTNDILRTSFRVSSDKALQYWVDRLDRYEVKHDNLKEEFGRQVLYFEDFDQQRYAFISDEGGSVGVPAGEPWHDGPVPDEFAIVGLGPVYLSVDRPEFMSAILTDIMGFKAVATENDLTRFETGDGGNGASVIMVAAEQATVAQQGYGGVHHVAFRVADKAQLASWKAFFDSHNWPHSGLVERYYFESLYFRFYPNILFELATDGPGFIDDEESYEELGQKLTLPPHLRHYRQKIEEDLKPFDSIWTTSEKEYLGHEIDW
ncbi:ring-cleaving dioxygenase [Bavariicoccus seileri]|uniref:ring-cleaving dioxygenase n=1 Tax=Bavariicoccus seileri TaxID=549685 RepID=UPI0003B79E2B|nr:ring-cleaving dioxygenase [Bavariicoccus seileri]